MGEQFDYLDAIEKALTPAVWAGVLAFARRRCQMLKRVGVAADAEELMMDAISDTTLGDRQWHYERYELLDHLCGVIMSRTSRQLDRTARVRHLPLGAVAGNDAHDPIEIEVSEARPPERPSSALERADLAERAVAALFAMAEAANDRQVMGILRAYSEEITERHEVAEFLGISPAKYDHAKKRLRRMLERLPEELRGKAA